MTYPTSIPPLPQATIHEPFDLRTLLRSFPGGIVGGPPQVVPYRRRIRLKGHPPARDVSAVDPLTIRGACDGIVRRMLLSTDPRPITIEYVAAAVLRLDEHCRIAEGAVVEEHLFLAGSHLDQGLLQSKNELMGMPFIELDGESPQAVAADAHTAVDSYRRQLEERVVRQASTSSGPILLDGSVRHLTGLPGPVVGVVKDVTTQFLGDESSLNPDELPVGWCSQAFLIPADSRRQTEVVSAYVRVQQASKGSMDGLMRIEVPAQSHELLHPLASLVCRSVRPPTSTDARIQVQQVVHVEDILRTRSPQIWSR